MAVKAPFIVYAQLAKVLSSTGATHAVKYLSPTHVVKATVRGKVTKRDRRVIIMYTDGQPNYKERAFIKACLKAGEPFPVKRIVHN